MVKPEYFCSGQLKLYILPLGRVFQNFTLLLRGYALKRHNLGTVWLWLAKCEMPGVQLTV